MKEWRSGKQREINNRAKCEDHGHSFQQTLLKTVRVRGREGGSGTGHDHLDQGQLRLGISVRLCACATFASAVHEISGCHM